MGNEMPDLWSERCWFSMMKKGTATWEHFHPIVETIDMDEGDKDIEKKDAIGGGSLIVKKRQGMSTITFEAYPAGIATTGDDDVGFTQQFHGQTYDETAAKTSTTTHTWPKYRSVLLWTDQGVSNATEAITTDYNAIRYTMNECYVTSDKFSYTDGSKKHTVLVKFAPFDKDNTANETVESAKDGETLDAVSNY